jgi:hypothetical protein
MDEYGQMYHEHRRLGADWPASFDWMRPLRPDSTTEELHSPAIASVGVSIVPHVGGRPTVLRARGSRVRVRTRSGCVGAAGRVVAAGRVALVGRRELDGRSAEGREGIQLRRPRAEVRCRFWISVRLADRARVAKRTGLIGLRDASVKSDAGNCKQAWRARCTLRYARTHTGRRRASARDCATHPNRRRGRPLPRAGKRVDRGTGSACCGTRAQQTVRLQSRKLRHFAGGLGPRAIAMPAAAVRAAAWRCARKARTGRRKTQD